MLQPFSRRVSRFSSVIGMLMAPFLITLVMLLSTAAPAQAAAATTTCTAFGSITMGKYWLNNNLWGQSSGSGRQCIWNNSVSGSTISWGTNWSWSGQSNSVKSYASSVLGWHWGWKIPGTGLPVQLSAGHNINTSWNFSLSGSSSLDVSYDMWLHTISNPLYNTPSDEVMVWDYHTPGVGPVGSRVATVSLDGASWDLYEGNIGWEVHSFLRTTNTTSQSLNLKDFLNYLTSHRGLSSSKYLNSIESGTEVFIGTGQLNVNSYSVNIS
jgi:hypothetical protein